MSTDEAEPARPEAANSHLLAWPMMDRAILAQLGAAH